MIQEFSDLLNAFKDAITVTCPVLIEDPETTTTPVVNLTLVSHTTNRYGNPATAEVDVFVRENGKGDISYGLEKEIDEILEYTSANTAISMVKWVNRGKYETDLSGLFIRTFSVTLYFETL